MLSPIHVMFWIHMLFWCPWTPPKKTKPAFDLDRMKAALESGTIQMPDGLSREEQREFILKQAE